MLPGLGSVLNDTYRLERELGRGRLGTVYAGLHLGRSAECAIRILPPESGDMQVERERFLRDHRIAKEISDGRLPEALDVAATESGQLFIVTPLCRGETLRQRLRRGALPQRSAFALVQRMCDILAGLHGRGVPHGSLHPENVVLGKDETILLLDLGLHHFMVGPLRSFPRRAPGIGWYAPPEIVESTLREADIRGDVFALGAILYEALAGRPAFPEPPGSQDFRGRSGLAQLARSVAPWELSPLLERILERACAAAPQDRPADALALAEELRALEAQLPEAHLPEARPAAPGAAAATSAPEEAAAEPAPAEPQAAEPASRRSRRRPLLHSADGEAQREAEPEPPSAAEPQGARAAGPAATTDGGDARLPLAPTAEGGPLLKSAPVGAAAPPKDQPLSPVAARLAALARGEFKPAVGPRTPRTPGTLALRAVAPKEKPQPQAKAPEPGPAAAAPAPSAATIAVAPEPEPAPPTSEDTAQPVPVPDAAQPSAAPAEAAPAAAPEPTEAEREAAKAIAAARVAAAARLLETARATARTAVPLVQPVPEPAPAAPRRRRRAPADLQELPPASGELVTDPREPPPLDSSEIIVSLPAPPAGSAERPTPPPLPAAVTQQQRPVPSASPAPTAAHAKPTARMSAAPIADAVPLPIEDGDDSLRTEQLKLVKVPPKPAGIGLQGALLAVAVLGGLGFLGLRWLPPAAPPPPPVAAPDPEVLQMQQIARKIDETDRALGAQDWHAALLRTDEVLRLQPDHAGAQLRRHRAESELANQIRYESFRAMAQHQNHEAALALFSEITDDSVYKGSARDLLQGVRAQYVADKLLQAQRARRLGLCSEVQRLTRAILAVDSGPGPIHDEAVTLGERCQGREDGSGRREAGAARREEPRTEHSQDRQDRQDRQEPAAPEAPGSTLKSLRDPFR